MYMGLNVSEIGFPSQEGSLPFYRRRGGLATREREGVGEVIPSLARPATRFDLFTSHEARSAISCGVC